MYKSTSHYSARLQISVLATWFWGQVVHEPSQLATALFLQCTEAKPICVRAELYIAIPCYFFEMNSSHISTITRHILCLILRCLAYHGRGLIAQNLCTIRVAIGIF
ncbi:hypothetical protein D5086_008691 [Populus alba]|uniref:Uncharacterized protein n=1 Tax=Populus alba TaxID=43335 RepID=A0ACC4CHP3_POPAL